MCKQIWLKDSWQMKFVFVCHAAAAVFYSPLFGFGPTPTPLEILCFVCTSIITSAIRAKVTGPSCSFQPAFLALASRGWRFFRGLLRRLLCSTDSLPYLPVAPVPIGYVHTLSHTHTRTHTHLIYTRADGR